MPVWEIAAFLAVLFAVFAFANLWFHLVEGLLAGVRRMLLGRRPPKPWHPLPPDPPEQKTPPQQQKP